VNGGAGRDVPRAAARLQDQHLPADPPVVRGCPDAAPRVFGKALVENDARKFSADIDDGKIGACGDSHALVRLRTELPDHAIGLAGGDDLRHAGVGCPSRAYARYVIDACDRIVGTNT
jgi:hypothetical protein